MPQIIVQAAPGERPGPVTLRERVNGNDLNSDHFAGQLVERIGWALLDAEDLEETADHLGRGRREADPPSTERQAPFFMAQTQEEPIAEPERSER